MQECIPFYFGNSVDTYIFLYRMKDTIRRVEDISIPTAVPDMLSIRSILSRLCEV